ncbi:5006_t:CDS:2 [Racocetra fulgida]|uniref:5006_t:CDS:1 n=1 Tax=Racocetra fulgida TaxID=60492 RepID=A0A9N8W055_9GLOM|nr:5006_t:CDS:2 [Racocetra fulgida]
MQIHSRFISVITGQSKHRICTLAIITTINTTVDENNAHAEVVPNNNEVPASQALPLTSHGSLVEGLQPITLPPGQQSQTDLLSNTIDSVPVENTISSGISGDEPFSFEALANICRMQQQTIALLVEEKTALASELEKYSAMADRFKSSEELLEEGQLLVDALRRQNSELEEKIRNGEDRLKDSDDQKKKIIESLQSQLEKDNKQLMSQLNNKDSIIEQLTTEKAKIRSVSDEVEALQKTLQDKEDRCEALEIELSNLRHLLTNAEQQLSEKESKLLVIERESRETMTKFESMTNQIQSLTDDKNRISQQLEEKSSELEALKNEFTEVNEQLKLKIAVVDELHREHDNFSSELQTSQSENSKLTKRIKDITTKNDGLSSDNRNLISQLTELQAKIVEINNDKLNLTEEVEKEKLKATKLEQEVAKIQKELASLKENMVYNNGTTLVGNNTTRDVGRRFNSVYNSVQNQRNDSTRRTSLSPPNSANRRYSFSQFSGDFEIGRCSGCIVTVVALIDYNRNEFIIVNF